MAGIVATLRVVEEHQFSIILPYLTKHTWADYMLDECVDFANIIIRVAVEVVMLLIPVRYCRIAS